MYSVRTASVSDVSLGRNVEVIETRNLLILEGLAWVGTLGQNQLAVGKYIGARSRVGEVRGGALGHRQFNQQRNRSMVLRQFDVKPKPCVFIFVVRMGGIIARVR